MGLFLNFYGKPANRFYAPNFEKVEGAYCFWLVRVYVSMSVRPLQKKNKLQF